jgi:hypothetical protein
MAVKGLLPTLIFAARRAGDRTAEGPDARSMVLDDDNAVCFTATGVF